MSQTVRSLLLGGSWLGCAVLATAQSPAPTPAPNPEEVLEMSPFEVSTSQDRGYYASNAISGSRVDAAIQDIPLTIEVVTSEFIKDTGATDLRESLRYSAGILLQTQNDAYSLSFNDPGGVNNPEGASADISSSSFKIRGFVTRNTLRNGFRRQHATDSVNIDRIEVVRGPSALLYGVGNFGGVVNYLPKPVLDQPRQEIGLTYGSDNFQRLSVDSTAPLPLGFGYRLTMAYEEKDDWTDLHHSAHYFVSPVLEWRPFQKTQLILDAEYGKADTDAIGFKSVRTPTLEGIPIFQTDRLETYGFLEFPGQDVRTFRWSGPDTYLDTDARNLNLLWRQGLTDDLHLMAGYNYSKVVFKSRDVFGGIATNPSNPRAQPFLDTIVARQIIDGQSTDVQVEVDNAVFQYNWTGYEEETDWHQARVELNYTKRLFGDSRWLASQHNLLLGYSLELLDRDRTGWRTADSPDDDNFMYKNPTDPSYIRFGYQSDGTPDLTFRPYDLSGNISDNQGLYAVYSGRFLEERLFLVGGLRQDTSSSQDGYYGVIGSRQGPTHYPDSEVRKQTAQYGASFELIRGLTLYALQSEGVEPNFDGQRDGLGRAIESSVAESREVGLKLNLWEGKVAATFSKFEIKREGLPFSYWWAPAPIRGQFRRTDPIVYRMDEFNPELKTDNRYLQAALPQWQAAQAAGAVYRKTTADGRATYTYLNASTPTGAAFLDRVFQELNAEFARPREERTDNDPWPGFLYRGFDDPEVNTAAEDWSSGDYFQTISDSAEGWEAQLILSPTDRLQVVLNYSNVKRQVDNPGNFVPFDFAPGNWDRWATWYFPNTNWGLGGVPPELVYPGGANGLPNEDTSTWTGLGWGQGEALDDTPEHVVSWWVSYRLPEEFLPGLQLGFGGQWESEREYASAFTTAGQKKQNETGTSVKALTDPRLTLNAMAKYEWVVRDRYSAFLQVNVDNLLDDQDQYGLIYAPGLSWKINAGLTF